MKSINRSTNNITDDSFYKIDVFASPPLKVKIVRMYIKLLALISKKRVQNYLVGLFATPRIGRVGSKNLYDKLELEKFGTSCIANLRDHKIFLYQEGEPEIILVYGWESSLNRMDTIMLKLRQNNIGFVTFDLPAHGKSSGERNHAILSAEIVSDILKMFPSVKNMLGHSFGGGVSYLALERPNSISKLITIGAPTQYSSVVTPFFLMLDLSTNLQKIFIDALSEYVGNDFTKYDLTKLPTYAQITHFVIHDKDDSTIPYTDAVRIKNANPDTSKILITEGLGHRKIMHDNIVIDKIIEFIQSDA